MAFRTVTVGYHALQEFKASWPCNRFPATLVSLTFEYAENGDLVDIVAKDDEGVWMDTRLFDGEALAALSREAQ
jgi:hypothetical protein